MSKLRNGLWGAGLLLVGGGLSPVLADEPAVAATAGAAPAPAISTTRPTEPAATFESFTLPRESQPVEPEKASGKHKRKKSRPEEAVDSRRSRIPALGHLNTQLALTLFPGMTDLSVMAAGDMKGRQLSAQFSPYQWATGQPGGTGSLEFLGPHGGLQLGNTFSELLGGAQGLRWVLPGNTPGQTSGLGLYQRLRGAERAESLLAMDTQWKWNKNAESGMLVAADSSWRVTQRLSGSRWGLFAFGGEDVASQRSEGGLLLEGRLGSGTRIINRTLGWGGDTPGFNNSTSVNQRLGTGTLALDRSFGTQRFGEWQRWGLGYYLPMKRNSLSVRLYDASTTSHREGGTRRSSSGLLTNYTMRLDSRTSLGLTGGFARSEEGTSPLAGIGASRSFGRWDIQTNFITDFGRTQPRFNASVGYLVNPDLRARVLFGPSLAASGDRDVPYAFGMQLIRNVNMSYAPSGKVQGAILIDGKPADQRLEVRMDREEWVKTDSHGRFNFRKIAPGIHTVQLRLSTLPVELSAVEASYPVEVVRGKTAEATFNLKRVVQVRGTIQVQTDVFGKKDPLAGVGVVLRAASGQEATTGGENEFVLSNLPPGKQRVEIVQSTLPPDYEVVGESVREIEVISGATPAPLQFAIAPRRRAIEFSAQ